MEKARFGLPETVWGGVRSPQSPAYPGVNECKRLITPVDATILAGTRVTLRRMPNTRKFSVASVLFGLSLAWTAMAQTASPKTESWMFQSEHVVGDIHDGFRKTCLIVYPNGDYHRERRRQVSRDGHAYFEWEAPEVIEATLPPTDLNALQAVLEMPGFSSINGAVGDNTLNLKLAFWPQGAVTPQEDIEILTVAVPRPNTPQVFEIADIGAAMRQEPLRALLDWIKGTERSQAKRLPASDANNCSSLIAAGNAPAGGARLSSGLDLPKAIYAPAPQAPHDTTMPQPVAVELFINPDGSVAKASLQGHPSPDIGESVLNAVRKWRFQPGRLLGVPVAMTLHMRIEFQHN